MTTTQSDKATLTKYPIAPASCVICLRSANGVIEFVDFQMNLDVYGSVNICVDCLAPVADMLDYVKRDDLVALNDQVRNLVEMNRELVANNERLNTTLDSILKLRPDVLVDDLPVDAKPSKTATVDTDQFTIEFDL